MLAEQQLASFFIDAPKTAEATNSDADFRSRVEDEIRSALLGNQSDPQEYATDDAFVAISGPITETLKNALSAVPRRGTKNKPDAQISRLPAERTLRFKSDLPSGAVIFASPIPGVYYKQWYLVLVLDRLIHRIVPLALKTSLPLTVRPHYYRL